MPPVAPTVFEPKDYDNEFDSMAYLKFYYSNESMENGTRLSLFALPTFAYTIANAHPERKGWTLADIGAGPTVYSAICFRDVVDRAYLADYLEDNVTVVRQWSKGETPTKGDIFDWTAVIRVVARTEGTCNYTTEELNQIEERSRRVVRDGGAIRCDVHQPNIFIEDAVGLPPHFDILVSVFCLESACSTKEEYRKALNNIISLIRPGGYLILGSVIEDDAYNSGLNRESGKPVYFSLLNLDADFVYGCLEEFGMDNSTMKSYVLSQEGVMFLMVNKRC